MITYRIFMRIKISVTSYMIFRYQLDIIAIREFISLVKVMLDLVAMTYISIFFIPLLV